MRNINSDEIQEYLLGITYPTVKGEVINIARQNGADEDALETLENIEEKEYNSLEEILNAISK